MRTFLKYGGVAALILLLASPSLRAQNQLELTPGYNINIPTGSFKDFISHTGARGFNIGLAYPINDQFRVGLSFGYSDYYQKYPRQVYDDGKGNAVSAVVSNSVQQLPLLLTANYTVTKTGFIRPYIGAGAGVNFATVDQYLGEFDNPRTVTKFALKSEAGVYIPLSSSSSTALRIGGSYNYSPYNMDGIKDLNTWGIEAGVRFPIH